MPYLKMILFNLGKHPRRTALILVAILASVLIMEIVSGTLEGIRQNFFTNMLADGGHGQVYGSGYKDHLQPWNSNIVLEDYTPLLQRLKDSDEVVWAEPIINFGAMLLLDDKNLTCLASGIQGQSRFFDKVRNSLASGAFPETDNFILISRQLAAFLDLSEGQELVLLAEDRSGSPYYRVFVIGELFETDSADFDQNRVLISFSAAQDLLWLPDGATELRFLLEDRDSADDFSDRLAADFAAAGAELYSWRELNAGLLMLIDMMDVVIIFFNLLMLLVAATVITNAILMNVFERLPEYGTLRAIGFRRRHLTAMILAEGAILGVAGSIGGLLVGIPLVLYFQHNGLDWGGISEAFGMGSFFTFHFRIDHSLQNLATGTLTALGGSLYAAWAASRMDIIGSLKET
ncbi:MAG: FtsX-like permease family protein [Spirochaetes bacterium]|nr:FtsX-like permease family protein [Spirochaetota bacterium]